MGSLGAGPPFTAIPVFIMGDSSYRLDFDQGKKNEIQQHS